MNRGIILFSLDVTCRLIWIKSVFFYLTKSMIIYLVLFQRNYELKTIIVTFF